MCSVLISLKLFISGGRFDVSGEEDRKHAASASSGVWFK